jgi:hypothetical protein
VLGRAWLVLVLVLVLLLGGCGHSGPVKKRRAATRAPITACVPTARDAMAHYLKVPAASIALTASTGNNAMPECSFRARGARKRRVELIANDYTGPSPYFILERTEVEASQVFTPHRMVPAPVAVTHLGIEADWFPAARQLMATDGVRLITVTIKWGGEKQAPELALAEKVTRTYLKHPKGQASLAKSYP